MVWQPESCTKIVEDLRLRASFLVSQLLANRNLPSKIQKLVKHAEIATGLSESLTRNAELKISHKCVFLEEDQFPSSFHQTRKCLPTQTSTLKMNTQAKTSEDLSQKSLIRWSEKPFGLFVLEVSLCQKTRLQQPCAWECLELVLCFVAWCHFYDSFLFFFLLKCCLITEYHNNSKTLPRGHLGRNCNISDHFREGRLGAGGVRRGLNSLEKMP